MTYTFRPAKRENVYLLIGLAGSSGSGKTFTAMRLATGMSGDKRFCVLDTESGRASHYADQFKFDVCELRPPFSPSVYSEAIRAAIAAGYETVVVDSMSHEYAGDGGVLDMQEHELDRMAGDDYAKRERVKAASWIKPKTEHKKMVQELLQVRAHLILCFRAEPKIDIVKGDDGKMKIVPKVSLIGLDGWIPITEKNLPFELTVSFMLTPDAPGVPKKIKLQEQHRALFPKGQEITEESGARIAEWASGGAKPKTYSTHLDPPGIESEFVTPDQSIYLADKCKEAGIENGRFFAKANVQSFALIPANKYQHSLDWIDAVVEHRKTKGE